MTPFDTEQGLGIADQPNLIVPIRYKALPLSATLAEKLEGFLAESVFCAWVPSGRKAATAIVKSNTGFFLFPPWQEGWGSLSWERESR